MSENKKSLEQLRNKCRALKTQLTILKNYLLKFADLAHSFTAPEIEDISYRLYRLKLKHNYFDVLQSGIESLISDDDLLVNETEMHEEIETNICKLVQTARSYISKFEIQNVQSICKDSVSSEISNRSSSSQSINLTTIELPTFDGDYTQWRAFEDTFTTLIFR